MEILYNNKFIVSILLGLLAAIVFYNFNKINHDKMNTIETGDDEIYINNDNQNKDYSLYVFIGISLMTFGILQVTQDNIDEVFTEIDVGEPPF